VLSDIDASAWVLTPSENPENHLKTRPIQAGDVFEDTAFKPWFEIVKF
jgi:hypothetical protein